MVSDTPAPDDASTTDSPTTDASTSDYGQLDRPLPPDLAARLAELFELDAPPETVAAWLDDALAAIRRVQGRDIAVGDLCHAEDGPHVARCDGETYRFVCVLDAFVLAGLTDESVAIESHDPETGEPLELTVTADGRAIAPDGTVVSLGVARDVPDGPLTSTKTYGALCPYVHAFGSEATYEAWADTVDAETTPLSVEDAAAAARILAGTA